MHFMEDFPRVYVHWDVMPPVGDFHRWKEASYESVFIIGNRISESLSEWLPNVHWTVTPGTTEGFSKVWVQFARRLNPYESNASCPINHLD